MRLNWFRKKKPTPAEIETTRLAAVAVARQRAVRETEKTGGEALVPKIVIEQAIIEQAGFESTHPVRHDLDQTRRAVRQRVALLVPGGKVDEKLLDSLLLKEDQP